MEPILDPETFTAADLMIVAEAIADHVNSIGDFTHYTEAKPITDQDLAQVKLMDDTPFEYQDYLSKPRRDARLLERVAWCDRAHESIQRCAETEAFDGFFKMLEEYEALQTALDLQSVALYSIIHWTQPEYYR